MFGNRGQSHLEHPNLRSLQMRTSSGFSALDAIPMASCTVRRDLELAAEAE
jgi:hypothetical protein